ncbi:MAG: DUF1827 family protein [Trichococcus flocculiformis]|jgi:hypothetical protein|uniref:DUF1827 family protein n=1 Tax=Trichococcus TaxID=82802 RepID=UPI0007A906DD|nr:MULTISPECIES: DUF1827 family protein [Trichococcus]MDK2780358.1 hypothetical protein [Trichococcus sp.]CZQ89538.1 Hypothetical protein TES5_787 [Trichococcus sp. ES5]SHF49241.1 protein of unknown function [Trichococcus flocculiformis]HRG30335.1 DUF1827 family protein [Trichococcus flocculiformis]HRM37957.1 DUF1827 family protein [Trichococcus flocculiformis]
MKLIDVTNSHADLVREQLANTDAQFVKVYSLGQTTVIFTGATTHEDVIILNKNRRVKQSEIDFVLTKLLHLTVDDVEVMPGHNFVELSHLK